MSPFESSPDADGLPAVVAPSQIAARLRQAGEMLRMQGESPFRAGAYETGADALDMLKEDLATLVATGRLTEIRGIGPSLAATISDLVRTGQSATLDRIMGQLPPALLELARAHLPGVTLHRIQTLHDKLGVSSLQDLHQALSSGAVETIKGFGPQTIAKLRQAVAGMNEAPATNAGPAVSRVLLVDALDWAQRLAEYLREAPGVLAAEVTGSIRRWVETVGDVNLIAASLRPADVLAALMAHPAVLRTVSQDARSCRLLLSNGMPVSLRVEAPETFAVGLIQSTGSKAHCDRLTARALTQGVDLQGGGSAYDDESAVYKSLGLPFIPPELREDAGEFEAAESGDTFADLIAVADIQGMVHCHTVYSDGRNTVAEMAQAAQAMGMKYITITDHSPAASYAGGVTPDRLPEQWREIVEAASQGTIRILRGTESDILRDGELDYPDDILQALDVVIASIHERHRMDAPSMTLRLVRAMEQPIFKIWGHGLGRLLLRRAPIECDVERILDAVTAAPAAIEINGSPHRLDLPAEWIRSARRRGIKFVISTDAHSTSELANLRFGVALARRGGVRRDDVLNTLPVDLFVGAVRPKREATAL
ncbi:MAG: PHP domain-containing protein [Deltaproteobacteria bacterium]|nr:PHP domain-containing protein [Deltaproteobacteria bacterium]